MRPLPQPLPPSWVPFVPKLPRGGNSGPRKIHPDFKQGQSPQTEVFYRTILKYGIFSMKDFSFIIARCFSSNLEFFTILREI